MISILRTDMPEFLDVTKRQLQSKDYSEECVLHELLRMQHSKCCYCERKLTDLGKTERWVEHIKPKSEFKNIDGNIEWNQANAWSNLLYSCATCNRKKGETPLIDSKTGEFKLVEPSHPDIEPENHITFFVDGVLIGHKPIPGSIIGKRTVDTLFIGRLELYRAFKKIKAQIDAIFAEIAGAVAVDDIGEFETLVNKVARLTCSKVAHAGFIRVYLKLRIAAFNATDLPQLNEKFGVNFESINVTLASGHGCLT